MVGRLGEKGEYVGASPPGNALGSGRWNWDAAEAEAEPTDC